VVDEHGVAVCCANMDVVRCARATTLSRIYHCPQCCGRGLSCGVWLELEMERHSFPKNTYNFMRKMRLTTRLV
jgi:hypothetical protein